MLPGAMVSPSAAERAETLRSPAAGALIEPATAVLRYIRLSTPAVQRTPWPNAKPAAESAFPCSTMLDAVGFSSAVVNTSASFASEASPLAAICAPPVPALLLQPRPGPPGGFEHGHEITPADPGSQTTSPVTVQPAGGAQRARKLSPES